jgi:hypothetical protein
LSGDYANQFVFGENQEKYISWFWEILLLPETEILCLQQYENKETLEKIDDFHTFLQTLSLKPCTTDGHFFLGILDKFSYTRK